MVKLRHRLPNGQSQWVLLPAKNNEHTTRPRTKRRQKESLLSSVKQFSLFCLHRISSVQCTMLIHSFSFSSVWFSDGEKSTIKVFRFSFLFARRMGKLVHDARSQIRSKHWRSKNTICTGDDDFVLRLVYSSTIFLHNVAFDAINKMTHLDFYSLSQKMHQTELLWLFSISILLKMKIFKGLVLSICEFNFFVDVFVVVISVTERLKCVLPHNETVNTVCLSFRFCFVTLFYYYKIEETCNEYRLRNTNESKFKFIFSFHRRQQLKLQQQQQSFAKCLYWCVSHHFSCFFLDVVIVKRWNEKAHYSHTYGGVTPCYEWVFFLSIIVTATFGPKDATRTLIYKNTDTDTKITGNEKMK